jgi:hypothetical protein
MATDYRNTFGITIITHTLYRHVAPDGTLRKDGLKVVEGGTIRYGKKKRKNDSATGLTPFSVQFLLGPNATAFPAKLLDYFFTPKTASFAALATRNLTTVLAGILIFCCVFGLKPVRAFLFCFTSLPNPSAVL